MTDANNDNPAPTEAAPAARMVRIIGQVRDDGRVVITSPSWRPSPRPAPHLHLVDD